MLVTLLGIVIEMSPLQAKVSGSILVTLLGISIEVRLWQLEKALFPMLVTLLGIVIEVRLVQPEYLQILLYQLLVC